MQIDSRELRNVLGHFATGVCVVTAVDKSGTAIGMTVNSFSALSLDPPLVLWCIQKDSDRFDAYNEASGFGVSVLGEDQQELSDRYARAQQYAMDAGSFRLGKSGQALLLTSIANFGCELTERIDGGDHIIMVGRVVEMASIPDSRPLVFYRGEYRQLG
jgi:flavin reductase (DIM6/NTAB) family NADH-FMN oxidoreductase RutF